MTLVLQLKLQEVGGQNSDKNARFQEYVSRYNKTKNKDAYIKLHNALCRGPERGCQVYGGEYT